MGIKEDIEEKELEIQILNEDMKELRKRQYEEYEDELLPYLGKLYFCDGDNEYGVGKFFLKTIDIGHTISGKPRMLADSQMFFNDGSFGAWEKDEVTLLQIQQYREITPLEFVSLFNECIEEYKNKVINEYPIFTEKLLEPEERTLETLEPARQRRFRYIPIQDTTDETPTSS